MKKNAQLTGAQAQYVIQKLLARRRISPHDVQECLRDLQQDIHEAERRLAALRGANAIQPQNRRKRRLSPTRLEALRVQGEYLGLVRRVPGHQRSHFSTIFREQGIAAAILALRMARKQ